MWGELSWGRSGRNWSVSRLPSGYLGAVLRESVAKGSVALRPFLNRLGEAWSQEEMFDGRLRAVVYFC